MNWRDLKRRMFDIYHKRRFMFSHGKYVAKAIHEYLDDQNDFCKINHRLDILEIEYKNLSGKYGRAVDSVYKMEALVCKLDEEIKDLTKTVAKLSERVVKESSVVYADDYEIMGRLCSCTNPARYNSYYDAFYCYRCDKWLEHGCSHDYPECHSNCKTRPAKPSEVKHVIVGSRSCD